MSKRFPKVAFGKCPRCGGGGGDDPDASGADAPATDTVGNGYKLIWFRGELMCEMCKKQILQEEESLLDRDKHNRKTTEFLTQAGFQTTIT